MKFMKVHCHRMSCIITPSAGCPVLRSPQPMRRAMPRRTPITQRSITVTAASCTTPQRYVTVRFAVVCLPAALAICTVLLQCTEIAHTVLSASICCRPSCVSRWCGRIRNCMP